MLKDIDVVESVQRSYTKRNPGLWDTPYKDRLEIINLEPLELRRLRFDVYDGYKILNGLYSMNKNDFFTLFLANTRQKFIFSGGRTDASLHFFLIDVRLSSIFYLHACWNVIISKVLKKCLKNMKILKILAH